MDPRLFQISALTGLLLYGVAGLDFEVGAGQILATLASVLGAQWLGSRMVRAHPVEYRSALISGLSLCLLGRAENLGWIVALGVIAIATKFLLRIGGKHIFNPTNIALAIGLLLSGGRVWVSPGQWGSVAVLAFFLVCLGGLVVMRARRADVTLAFLGCWAGLLFARAWWVGDPWTIPAHRLENGALLLFAFFMISDPKTTPDSRAGRIVFAALIAASAWWWQFAWYNNNGLIWSLAAWALAVPLLDRLLPGPRYAWNTPAERCGRSPSALVSTPEPSESLSVPELKPGLNL